MIKRKYVVAGNYQEYNEFVFRHRDNRTESFVYVDSYTQLTGLINIEGYYVGTYYKRGDIGQIKDIITMSKITTGYVAEPVTELYKNHVVAYKYHIIVD